MGKTGCLILPVFLKNYKYKLTFLLSLKMEKNYQRGNRLFPVVTENLTKLA